jgi:hypothetical protein
MSGKISENRWFMGNEKMFVNGLIDDDKTF